jgi:O-methyltransferase
MTVNLSTLYIETLKSSLLNELYIENEARIVQVLAFTLNNLKAKFEDIYHPDSGLQAHIYESKQRGATIVLNREEKDGSMTPVPELRNYTELAHTMIGRKRLDNLQFCIEEVIKSGIPGDLIETGIWRGGATIFMRGVLDAGYDISARALPVLSVGLEEVQQLFKRYGLLDEQVSFLKGWFKDTLAKAPIEKLAVLRLDGDLYESTMDALNPLYPKVASGGFIIVDDYFAISQCEQAILDFRSTHGISDPIHKIDDAAVYWRKS